MRLKKFNQLNEEIGDPNWLSKQFESMRKTELSKSEINIDDEKTFSDLKDVEWVDVNKCEIYWDYELVVKRYGIDSIIPVIKKIELMVTVYVYDQEKDMEEGIDKEFSYNVMNSDIETENENGLVTIPYYPTEIDISHLETSEKNKTKIEVKF